MKMTKSEAVILAASGHIEIDLANSDQLAAFYRELTSTNEYYTTRKFRVTVIRTWKI